MAGKCQHGTSSQVPGNRKKTPLKIDKIQKNQLFEVIFTGLAQLKRLYEICVIPFHITGFCSSGWLQTLPG
ncbi:hypothetical protein EON09_13740 [Pseudomonas soli]|uniref:hypothetical protein n=1 Tax=Pseudomonas TaxID=286 RepID=UPI001160C8D3|nr:hypothetical protein [Pseudomonas soli]MDT3714288.1 hypothetical protein [Pseudomonas soli]MDT3731006.1 hypothetical protein [Pseudomonas soli]NBK39576.1 hypothetical protein [Pseudomonas soli]WJO22983.1 hypothetical protein LU688_05145 [Pseudomonas soli]